MARQQILFLQIRRPDDKMIAHEAKCIIRRVSGLAVEVVFRNIFEETPTERWLDGVDGLLLGGSGDFSVHVPQSARWVKSLRHLLDAALTREMPGFGLCFGHQLLGYHLGGEVETDSLHGELGTVEVQLTAQGLKDPVFAPMGKRFKAHTGHSDYVLTTPPGVELLASNDATTTQAFRISGSNFYSTQFHPDLSGAEARYRARAYQLGDDIETRFHEGEDATNELLSRFVKHAMGLESRQG